MQRHAGFETDVIPTSQGALAITFLGHGSLLFEHQDRAIYVDPYSRVADYTRLPHADLILITHEHGDHLDPAALSQVRTEDTAVIIPAVCLAQIPDGLVMRNGDTQQVFDIQIEAVPAYNVVHKRETGAPFHPPGVGNGYVLGFGDTRVYVAGDTEDIPEMRSLQDIDVAFLPMNLPYTMTPEMVANAARAFSPRILYPYHYGRTDPNELVRLLKDRPDIEVRIRDLA
ncbi:MAG TPA: MBL fold metallo-hydrolase [Chloroflexi bacterium]|nr:MBL fold metallo-hydrolase [Chloroflexota bacterium]